MCQLPTVHLFTGFTEMKRVHIGARISPEDYGKLKAIASDTGRSLSEVVGDAIARYVGHRGAGGRVASRLDDLEAKVGTLTTLVVGGAGSDRHHLAQQFLDQLTPR